MQGQIGGSIKQLEKIESKVAKARVRALSIKPGVKLIVVGATQRKTGSHIEGLIEYKAPVTEGHGFRAEVYGADCAYELYVYLNDPSKTQGLVSTLNLNDAKGA